MSSIRQRRELLREARNCLVLPRRTLLGGAGAAAVLPRRPRAALSPSAASPLLLRPGNKTKLRCAILYGSQWPEWAYPWGQWTWDGFWRPAIEAAASVGANCIKFNCGGVSPDGSFNYPSSPVLQAELIQVCNYAASLGMVVYLQLAYQPRQQFLSDGTGVSAGTAAAARIAGWANSIPNIVAIDCLNEWDASQPGTWAKSGPGLTQALSDMASYLATIAAATSKPLTISALDFGAQGTLWSDPTIRAALSFLDMHYYYYNNPAGLSQPVFQSPLARIRSMSGYPGRFILGETGMPGGASGFSHADQTAWMNAVPSLTSAGDCYGGCFWTLGDTFGPGLAPGNWGMFNQNFTENRTWISGPFSQWPGQLG